ncbi:hypothetical protein [Bradyrhizobium erythrophlei]|uniref:Phage-related minor tail protein n=1 Tax=Bradyrhizobium erythrophlei TaxID=1437360 RepID=A0A1M5NQY4_9BRAD|nr:hypothetical protein [Bradyrhizobium erythrophlei]SHG91952.1 hypothetical protein SAMN05443248_3085 [Bradyrhizobium erythrophlei]
MSDAYKIGVSIVLANGMSSVLAVIGKDLLGLKTSVGEVEKGFGKWGTAIAGVGLMLGGAGILGVMTKLVETAADFQDAMTKVSQLNPKVAELVNNGEIRKLSFGLATKLGMKVEDVANIYGGVFGVLQDPEEAEKITPYAARYARLMEMRHPGSHPEESINTLMRAGELSGRLSTNGAIDPEKVKKWFDTVAQLQAATHGQVDAQTLLGLAQQAGGGAMRGLTEEGFDHMAILSQMMGGQRAGTALLSLRSQMTGSMMKRNAEAMLDYNVLRPGEATSEGGHVSLTPEATSRLLGMLNKDPVKFVDYLVKTLEAQGITDQEQQIEAISRMVGRQTSNREIQDILLSRQQMERETTGLKQGATVDEGLAGFDRNLHAAQQNLGAAWHNLQVAMGEQETDKFADILNKIASGLNSVTDSITRLTPEQMDKIFEVITGIAVGMITIGGILTAALVTSIVGLPVILGAAGFAFAAVGATIAAFNWDKITANAEGARKDILSWENIKKSFSLGVIGEGLSWVGARIVDLSHLVDHGLTTMFNGIESAISGFINFIEGLYNRVKGLVGPSAPLPESHTAPNAYGSWTPAQMLAAGMSPVSFNPGTDRPKPQPVSLSLNVDGRTLAQTVSAQLAELMMFPTGAGAPDHWGQWADADSNLSTT